MMRLDPLPVRVLPPVVAMMAVAPSAQAALMNVPGGLPRSAAGGELVTVTASLAGAERCTFHAGSRRASASVAGAERVSFRFRSARDDPARAVVRCGRQQSRRVAPASGS